MITRIYLPNEMDGQFLLPEPGDSFSGLNRVNIFVGPNNSAKSRFLRGLFLNDWRYQHSQLGYKSYAKTAGELQHSIHSAIFQLGFTDVGGDAISGVGKRIDEIVDRFKMEGLPDEFEVVKDLLGYVDILCKFKASGAANQPGRAVHFDPQAISDTVREIAGDFKRELLPIGKDFKLPNYKKIYIPMLRGLRPVQTRGSSGYSFEEN